MPLDYGRYYHSGKLGEEYTQACTIFANFCKSKLFQNKKILNIKKKRKGARVLAPLPHGINSYRKLELVAE